MTCQVCGAVMQSTITDLPFKVSPSGIVILKALPVLQCEGCEEFLINDAVMERVEAILDKVDKLAELEIVKYAA